MRKKTINKSILYIISILLVFVLSTGGFLWLNAPYMPSTTQSADHTATLPATSIPTPPVAVFPTPRTTLDTVSSDGITLYSYTKDGYFYINKKNTWTCSFLKGVNMGLTLPDTDLNNPDISYATYYQWFTQISAMNANTVKIFTIMNPDFYNAFYAYNKANLAKPLYLLQGIWVSENDVYEIGDAFGANEKILKNFKRAITECLDATHGKSDYTSYGSIAQAVYDKDVSPYVAGYILGLEWPPDFISATNTKHPGKALYKGNYLYTENASPFEAFLCEAGDSLIAYETEHYQAQTPVAFLNWSTTDLLKHSNEPFPEEDSVALNTNNIHTTDRYYAGMFAALDVYPYYPEFLNYQQEYIDYKDETGLSNPYRAYLKDLKAQYNIPVLIAEFGVPSSRGEAHASVMGYNQGNLTEEQQGTINSRMIIDIAKESYAGAMVFSWQDEWFKQVWNTIKYAPQDASQRCYNVMSAEQSYGLLGFTPLQAGKVYPDGDLLDWANEQPIYSTPSLELYCKADEAYLHIMGKLKSGTLPDTQLAIPIGLTGKGSQFSNDFGVAFGQPTDFLLVLDGKDNTRLLTDSYYDIFYYNYSVSKKVFPEDAAKGKRNSGVFSAISQFLSNEIVLPVNKKTIAPVSYESGKLLFGNANPESSSYNSLADFYFTETNFEIRIPWYLLNVANAAEKTKIADFYQNKKITFDHFEDIYIGGASLQTKEKITMVPYSYGAWQQSHYESRLKKSYTILQQTLSGLMTNYP